jgi:hypothetical protein
VLLLTRFRSLIKYAIVFITAVIISLTLWNFNLYLLFRNTSYSEDYDYIIYVENGFVKVKNGASGQIDFSGKNFSQILKYLFSFHAGVNEGLKIFIRRADYNVSCDILLENCKYVKMVSDGAKLNLNGHTLTIKGESWEDSNHNNIEGFTIIGGRLIIENSFMTTIKDCIFIDTNETITLLNSNGWTECTTIEHCYFINPKLGITFKTPMNNGTRSYANTEIKQCYFELRREGAVGIYVEPRADFNEGLIQNVRFWMGAMAEFNQTGILVKGSMLNTLMQNVVFESFAKNPEGIYGIILGENCDPPILGHGIVFCGNLTGSISNRYGKWLYGASGSFKVVDAKVPIGSNSNYGEPVEVGSIPHLALAISSMNIKIKVEGSFSEGETVYVRLRLKFIDGLFSKQLEIPFNETRVIWPGPEELLDMWPTRNIVVALIVDAKTTANSSNVSVKVSMYGLYG